MRPIPNSTSWVRTKRTTRDKLDLPGTCPWLGKSACLVSWIKPRHSTFELPLPSPPLISRVLHLHPTEAPAALVSAVDPLRDDPFEAHGASVAEHRLAIRAVQVVAVEQRGPGPPEVLAEQAPALDEGEPAEVLVADLQEVEGVEARYSAARAPQERVEVRKALRAVRDGLAVQDDPGDRQGHDGGRDRDELV